MRQPLLGVSAAGYRLEGGFNGPGEPANQWGPWERAGMAPPGVGAVGVWADPDRVLDLATSVGAEALVLSVEWARVEPAPGHLDEAAVDRYASLFAAAASRGVTPVGVLCDVATPGWLGEEYWLTPGSPDRFADHVAHLVARLGVSCRHWVTLRQPNLVALSGWVAGRHPPRRVGALSDAWAVVDNLLAAHVLAYRALHDAQSDAVVLLGLRASTSYEWHRLFLDLLCAPALGVERDGLDAWIDVRRARHDRLVGPGDLGELAQRRLASVTAPFGTGGKGIRRRLRRPSPRRALEVAYRAAADARGVADRLPSSTGSNGARPQGAPAYPLDALLVGWCPPHAEAPALPGRRPLAPWAVRPDPDALAAWCREQRQATPGLSLWVEDGFATHGRARRADGWDRQAYLRAQVAAAEEAGVAGYLYFTLEGGGDPAWPDASFGLERAPGGAVVPDRLSCDAGSDAACYRRLVEERRGRKGANAHPL